MRHIKILLATFFLSVSTFLFGQTFSKSDGRQMATVIENSLKKQDSTEFIQLCFLDKTMPDSDDGFDSTEVYSNFYTLRTFLRPSFRANKTFSKIEIKKCNQYEKLKKNSIYSVSIWYPSKKTDYIGYTLYLDFIENRWKIRSPALLGTKDIN